MFEAAADVDDEDESGARFANGTPFQPVASRGHAVYMARIRVRGVEREGANGGMVREREREIE